MDSYKKDPQAKLDYVVTWASWLGADTISTSTWTITGAPDDQLTIVSDSHTDTAATVWLTGGTLTLTYRVTNHIVTDGGRENDQTIVITCLSR